MKRITMMMRRFLHVKGDVVCTLLLLLLLCLLLYTHQDLLSSGWDRTSWRLEFQGSTISNRALLGASGRTGKTGRTTGARGSPNNQETLLASQQIPSSPPDPLLPVCKPLETRPQARSKPSQSRSKAQAKPKQPKGKSKGKVKEWRKNVVPTKMAAAASSALPTMPPFDFEGYLREKDNRNFTLLIDQPDKCRIGGREGGGGEGGREGGGGGGGEGGREGGGGGETSSAATTPYMLIAVKSVAADFDKRQVVRRTWGKEGLFPDGLVVRTVFLLGVPRNRTALPLWDRLLAYESQTFRDILLWDFEDTFFNLTLKETHFLEWVNTSCPDVRFIFKGDADVYVNVENILEMLRGQRSDQDLFVGDIIFNAKPIRRRSSKYYVPEFMYGAALYPSYAGGGGFVMSGFTARRLSSACQQVELFPIDDVFLGMCLQRIGIKPSRHEGFRTFGIVKPSAAPHLQTFDPCFYRELMVVHSLTGPQIWLMWNLLHDPKLSCHRRRGPTPWPFRWRGGVGGTAGTNGDAGEEPTVDTDYGVKKVFRTH